MGRRNRRADEHVPLRDGAAFGVHGTERHPDGEWHVRSITGERATKEYLCPGCNQRIPAGTAHVVAWRDERGAEEARRHWHTPCWRNRARRR